jgi:hypothetical protein
MNEFDTLASFLDTLSGKAIDFYPVSNRFSRAITQQIKQSELKIFGRTQADCLIGYWNYKRDKVWSQKIVWIDSEGMPNEVIADNIIDFISLLYFDTGFIYDVLKEIIRDPKYSAMKPEELKKYEDLADKSYPHFSELKNFLEKELQIKKPDHPDLKIKDALLNNSSFSAWLHDKTT